MAGVPNIGQTRLRGLSQWGLPPAPGEMQPIFEGLCIVPVCFFGERFVEDLCVHCQVLRVMQQHAVQMNIFHLSNAPRLLSKGV